MKPLTLKEAAQFLRMSRSSLYQRKDVPRYRRPGSNVYLFDQDELEAWLKQGRVSEPAITMPAPSTEADDKVVEISQQRVYHRSARYR